MRWFSHVPPCRLARPSRADSATPQRGRGRWSGENPAPFPMRVTVHPVCQEELYNPGRDVSINPDENSILTPQRPVPDVRLGYASTGQLLWVHQYP